MKKYKVTFEYSFINGRTFDTEELMELTDNSNETIEKLLDGLLKHKYIYHSGEFGVFAIGVDNITTLYITAEEIKDEENKTGS